jgi:hypothetical protein
MNVIKLTKAKGRWHVPQEEGIKYMVRICPIIYTKTNGTIADKKGPECKASLIKKYHIITFS